MAESAVVALAALTELHERSDACTWPTALPLPSIRARIVRACLRVVDRVRAKLAFHNSNRYRELVKNACGFARDADLSPQFVQLIRKVDPHGLGIWYLARCVGTNSLVELCRRAFATPGTGPPRTVARSLERALAGDRVCWFGESGGFDALGAETLVVSALAATLAATELAWFDGKPPWGEVLNCLTVTANATQSAVRAQRRVRGQVNRTADEACRLAYQAVNVVRRALNHTDLLAVDEQMAREAARLALDAGSSACSAAVQSMTDPCDPSTSPDAAAARSRLAALARSVDALISRVATSVRNESAPAATSDFVLGQAARVLDDAPKALRRWFIHLPMPPTIAVGATASELCRLSNSLAEASTETLESWATLHELISSKSADSNSGAPAGSGTKTPVWAVRLVRAATGKCGDQEVIESIRDLGGPADRRVAAAVCIAALSTCSLKLRRELWKLIRDANTSDQERSLAFQLFWRLHRC
jgi:hypothetical protein